MQSGRKSFMSAFLLALAWIVRRPILKLFLNQLHLKLDAGKKGLNKSITYAAWFLTRFKKKNDRYSEKIKGRRSQVHWAGK